MFSLSRTGDNGQKQQYFSHMSFLTPNQKQALENSEKRASGYSKFTSGVLALGVVVVKYCI